jgi:hypothetical protein
MGGIVVVGLWVGVADRVGLGVGFGFGELVRHG